MVLELLLLPKMTLVRHSALQLHSLKVMQLIQLDLTLVISQHTLISYQPQRDLLEAWLAQ